MAKRATIKQVNPNDLVIIGLDTEDGEDHPLYDKRIWDPIPEELVKNIKFYGVIQTVNVREEDGKLLVVDGRRRVRAARLARKLQEEAGEVTLKVPTTTHGTAGDDKRLAGVMVSANEQRQDDSIIAKALKCAHMQNLGCDLDEIANAFGKSEQTIRLWLKLLEADPRLHDAISEDLISYTGVKELLSFPREEQYRIFSLLFKQSGETKVTQAQVLAFKKTIGATNRSDIEEMDLEELTKSLEDSSEDGEDDEGSNDLLDTVMDLSEKAEERSKSNNRSKPRKQTGVRRGWLRKALDTDAASKLKDEQYAVLNWVANGDTGEKGWWTKFEAEANKELADS